MNLQKTVDNIGSTTKLKMLFGSVEVLSHDRGWKMLCDIEGDLKIIIGNKVLFDVENILLLELALALMKWIDKIESGNIVSFYYESMDYEDKPILAFTFNDDFWKVYSVWQVSSISENKLSLEEAIYSSKSYIAKLLAYLKSNFEFDFLLLLRSQKS